MVGLTRRLALGGLAAAASGGLRAAAPARDGVVVFEARKIITMEPAQPSARFVAVANGLILGVAERLEELEPWTGGTPPRIERRFADKVLMPGLIDPHVHPMQAAVMLNIPFLAPDDWDLPTGRFPGVRTPEAWQAGFSRMLAASDADPFICWGQHDLFHGPVDRALLDRLAPDRPVVIWQRSFHEIILNTAMLRKWGVDSQPAFDAMLAEVKADPHHGNLARGILSESALLAGLARLRPIIFEPGRVRTGLAHLQTMMTRRGVTTISDMATGLFAGFDVEAGLIRSAFERPDSMARVMLMPAASFLPDTIDPDAWLRSTSAKYASHHVRVDRRVKMLADGAFFALNMRMNPPGYLDGHLGKWITEPAILDQQFRRFWDAGFAMHIHVNGDEGLDVVLDALARLPARREQSITLEHLGYSTEAQNLRIARMGLMVSAQPNYIRVLGEVYGSHGLGADRAAQINRLGSLERKGVPLGLHSDFNMAPIDPLYLAWIAANRITLDGNTLAPAERISLDKALRAITIEAAQVIGMDAMVGSIAAGKRADFVALDQDPYKAGAARLKDLRIAGTVFEGRIAA